MWRLPASPLKQQTLKGSGALSVTIAAKVNETYDKPKHQLQP